jgi:hypothetical protein
MSHLKSKVVGKIYRRSSQDFTADPIARVEVLMEKEYAKQKKLEREREKKRAKEIEGCTFKPKVLP